MSWTTKEKKLQFETDEMLAKINSASKEIGQLMEEGRKEEAGHKKSEVALYKEKVNDIGAISEIENALHALLVQLPNLPSAQVPAAARRPTMQWCAPVVNCLRCMRAPFPIGSSPPGTTSSTSSWVTRSSSGFPVYINQAPGCSAR